ISGTFTFLRALADRGNDRGLTPAQIGESWLNYIIEGRTILWWGGLGNSTEHTAYLRLQAGIPAPQSGSVALNGQIVAQHSRAQRGALWVRQVHRQLPHGPEPRADHARLALRRRRLPTRVDDHQHGGVGHRLQLRQRRLPAGDQEWPGRTRCRPRLARPGR